MGVEGVAQKKIIEQERFYYDRYAFTVLLTLLSIGLSVVLLGLNFLLHTAAVPPPTYFAETTFGELVASSTLEKPNIQNNVLLNWVAEVLMASNTFNFINYNNVISSASLYFTKEGFNSYQDALNNNKILEQVLQKKLVLRAMPTDAPQILLEKPFAGRYMWKIKIPMQFKYYSVAATWTDNLDVTLIVMRVPTVQSPNGVSILKLDIERKTR